MVKIEIFKHEIIIFETGIDFTFEKCDKALFMQLGKNVHVSADWVTSMSHHGYVTYWWKCPHMSHNGKDDSLVLHADNLWHLTVYTWTKCYQACIPSIIDNVVCCH